MYIEGLYSLGFIYRVYICRVQGLIVDVCWIDDGSFARLKESGVWVYIYIYIYMGLGFIHI